MDEEGGDLKRRVEGPSNPSHSTTTSKSIESARRFLYDEDEPPIGNPANTPISSRTSLSEAHLGGDGSKTRNRLNPFVAAVMSTFSTCRNFGLKRLLIAAVGTGVILLLALGVSALRGRNNGGEKENPVRRAALQKVVVNAGIATESALSDPETPQYHALSWLANIDESKLDSSFLLERYALAVLYYSTAGTFDHVDPKGFWTKQDNWMTTKGICTWHGITCGLSPDTYEGDGAVTALELAGNFLQGSFPSELAALSKLITLDLSTNNVVGHLPSELQELSDLRYLFLGQNNLINTIPSEFGRFSNLREVDLGHNHLSGTLPPAFPRLLTMRRLGLEYNAFHGTLPNMSNVRHIISLFLQGNEFTGSIPNSFTHMTSLEDLRISENHISGSIPTSLQTLVKLEIFHASSNELTGTLPAEIFTALTRLLEFSVAGNSLESTIPTTLGKASDLTSLSLASNAFTGSIPKQFSLLVDLESLEIQDNQLTGTFPAGFSAMKDLKIFRAHNNQISDVVSPEFGLIHGLTELRLEQNQLTGSVPTELANLSELTLCRLDGNDLTGSVPWQVCALTDEYSLQYLSVDCDSGSVICTCCTKCF